MIEIPEHGEGVVILGSHGTLGQQLATVFPAAHSFDRQDLDVTDNAAVRAKLSNIAGLCAVINCVAYNDVDGAESKRDTAFLLNATVPGQLAAYCKELNISFVHFSTGYVFPGSEDNYTETSQPQAISVYAESKLKGEQEVIAVKGQYYLIRTNVLFGSKGQGEASKPSFVDIMVNLSKKINVIKVVDDETNSITYASDLAATIKDLVTSARPEGIYHIVNTGSATWFELATQIFTDLGFTISNEVPSEGSDTTPDGKHITLLPVAGSEFPSKEAPRPAKRPARVVLQNTKLPTLRPWQEALKEYLNSLLS